jgi:pimeloyl-ACP methyl ester carboxylesterase
MGAVDAQAALDAIVADCGAERACAAAFPEFRQDIDRAFAALDAAVPVEVRDPATGLVESIVFARSDLAYATRGLLYGAEALRLPDWFHRAAAGDYTAFAQAYVSRARQLEPQIAMGVHLGVYCTEDLPFVDWPAARAAAAGTRVGTYLLDQYRAACGVWPNGTAAPLSREPVSSDVPALLMSGRRDPVSPPRTGAQVARTLSASRHLIWQFGGHSNDGIAEGGCRVAILEAFVRTADTRRLPDGCMAGPPLPFR